MNKSFLTLSLLTALGLTAYSAVAQLPSQNQSPSLGASSIPLLTLNGEGLRIAKFLFLKFEAYRAKLFVTEKTSDPELILNSRSISKLSIEYLREFSLKDTQDAWEFQFKDSQAPTYPNLRADLDALKTKSKPIRKGDRHEFIFKEKTSEFWINEEKMHIFESPEFRRSFLTIFLGPKPPTPELKKGLLGQ